MIYEMSNLVRGLGIVYCFLSALIVVTLISMKGIARFDSIFPKETPKKAPAAKAASDDADIALAIAVAMNG